MNVRKILVVEDDESLRRVMQAQLEKVGHKIAVAADAQEALMLLVIGIDNDGVWKRHEGVIEFGDRLGLTLGVIALLAGAKAHDERRGKSPGRRHQRHQDLAI